MISSATTGPPTFAASAYFTQYKVDRNWATPTFAASAYNVYVQYISIACEAANGHTCYLLFVSSRRVALRRCVALRRRKKHLIPDRIGLCVHPCVRRKHKRALSQYNTL